MTKFLIHITTGADNPSKAALAFLVAKTAIDEGNEVAIFAAADGVNLLRKDVAATLVGVGTGVLAEHLAAIGASHATVIYSGMSAKARGIEPGDLALPNAQPGMPSKLLALAAAADVVLTY